MCTCGHGLLAHGDRAIVACDGNWRPRDPRVISRNWSREGPGPVCGCPGWTPVAV